MTKENNFSPKMETKSIQELKSILYSKNDYVQEAKQAAAWELEKRQVDPRDAIDETTRPIVIKGEDKYKMFIKGIKPKHSFGFRLKNSESFQTSLPYNSISTVFADAFEDLNWIIIYHQKDQIEAKRSNDFDRLTEKITVKISKGGKLDITSQSLDGSFWDVGRNSKRVKLLIHVFNEIAATYNDKKLEALLFEIQKFESLEDYVIPETLPKPEVEGEPSVWIPLTISVISSVLLGLVFAFALKHFYIILLYESGLGIALAFLITLGIKRGKYTNYVVLRSITGLAVVGIVFLGQYFQHLFISLDYSDYNLSFIEFMEFKFAAGFEFDGYNTGWIGMLVILIVQLVVLYSSGILALTQNLTDYQIKRVPGEVIDFAIYHWSKSESEDIIRKELSLKGWVLKTDQDKVFDALGAIGYQQEAIREV